MWRIYQYRTVFDDHYTGCDSDTQNTIDVHMDILQEKGNRAGTTISRYLEDGLCELKAKGERFIYFFMPGQKIVFFVAAHKDQRKLRRDYFELAKRRRKEILGEQENIYVINNPYQTKH